jgi:putative ABC transport system permease protein
MFRLFLIHSLRYFARHRTLTAFNILGIALGVAVFVSVQVVNHSALSSFRASVDIVAGRANLEVTADGLPFDESIYPLVRQHPGVLAATPVIQEVCLLPDYPGEYLQLLGVDVFSNGPLRTYEFRDQKANEADAMDFIKEPHHVALSEALCKRLGLKAGDSVRLETKRGIENFKVAFILKFNDDAPGADEHLAVMDIANVQENYRLAGKLTRIDCRLRDGVKPETVIASLQPLLPGNVVIHAPDRRGNQIEKMIGAFQLNLVALSLVSLMVGMFLIYNTVSAAVVRRRHEIGVLRALGLTANQVQGLFLAEALLQGLCGLALGIALGVVIAWRLVGAVSQTITSLYILLSIREIFVAPQQIAAAIILGVGAVLLAAWFPSREASRIPPVEALAIGHLNDKSRLAIGRWSCLGVGMLVLAAIAGWLSLYQGVHWLSFGAALGALMAFAFFTPVVCVAAVKVLRRTTRGVVARLALEQFAGSLHRNSVTIAALVTALSMVAGISLMIFSFRMTVQHWLDRSVVADVFVAPAAGLVIGNRETIRPELEDIVKNTPGIEMYDRYHEVRMTFRGQQVKLAAIRFPVNAKRNRLVFKEGDLDCDGSKILLASKEKEEVVVSEAFARKFGVKTGDALPLRTASGLRDFRVAGVFYDYTTEFGLVLMDQDVYRKWWNDWSFNSFAIYLLPETSVTGFQNELRTKLAPYGEYLIYSNRELRVQVFRIFDQTFTVTYLLQTIGILVSGIGIFLSLLILVNERSREIGILRAVGASRAQVIGIILGEATLVAVIGALLGLAGGWVLAWILSDVINVSYFGWTIVWATPWRFLFELPFGVLLAAWVSAWWPARKAAEIDIASAVKME